MEWLKVEHKNKKETCIERGRDPPCHCIKTTCNDYFLINEMKLSCE